jgi:hypothetical protein
MAPFVPAEALTSSETERLRRVAADCRAKVSAMSESAQRENRPRSSAMILDGEELLERASFLEREAQRAAVRAARAYRV